VSRLPPNLAVTLTPPGAAAIAVVRLAGTGVRAFLERHFSRPARAGRCVHGELRDEAGEVIDDPVVVLSVDGGAADVNVHGGPWVVASVLDLARRHGFDVAETTDQHVANVAVDADDVLERDVVAHLPRATTEQAIRVLLAQPKAWAAFLASRPARAEIERVLSDRGLWWMLHPPRVAIVGPPNVGKSTLANRLFAQDRSIVADVPGTTRDWVGETANLDGLAVTLVDTPGVRETADPIEREAIERSAGEVRGADAVVLVLDASRPLDDGQRQLMAAHPNAIVVANKSDRGFAWAGEVAGALATVATMGVGVDELRRRLRARFDCDDVAPARPRWWTERQRASLRHLAAAR
jgi:tRNA modification GTPase